MYANADEATQGLRYGGRPLGRILDEKTVARNTKLIRFDPELIGLKLHDTVIATYHRDGVRFDLRGEDSLDGEGWFTDVTLRRLDEFTPARVIRADGLTYIVANPSYGSHDWTKPARLYTHGCHITSDSSFENGLEPAIERAIAQTHGRWPRMAKNYAKRCVAAWRRFQGPPNVAQVAGEGVLETWISRVQRNEVVVPRELESLASRAKQMGLYGDRMADELAKQLYSDLFQPLQRPAVKRIEPNFPYPQRQTEPRR